MRSSLFLRAGNVIGAALVIGLAVVIAERLV
jgi:hypothetical protein